MASKWTLPLPSGSAFNARASIQLSDGTHVFLASDSGGTHAVLYYSSDHTTLHSIDSITIDTADGATLLTGFGLCRDAANNLYVLYITGSGGAATTFNVKAYVKGSGYAWTAQTVLTTAGGIGSGGLGVWDMAWCNTGGGTGGAGHLVAIIGYNGGGYTANNLMSLDAGAALAGTGTVFVATISCSSGTYTGTYPYVWKTCVDSDLSPDGFGATEGLLAVLYENGDNTDANISYAVAPEVRYWTISSTGSLTATQITSGPSGFPNQYGGNAGSGVANSSKVRLLSLGSGSWALLTCYADSSLYVQLSLSTWSTSACTANAVRTGTPSDWVADITNGSSPRFARWDAFVDPEVPNRVWALAWSAFTDGRMNRLGCNTSPIAWDAAVTVDDNGVGSATATTISYEDVVVATKQPVGLVVDYHGEWYDGSAWHLDGDVTQIELSANLPTLLTPSDGFYEDVTSGPTFSWQYNPADGSGQAGFAFRRKVSGAAGYLYWNATTNAWQTTPIYNTQTAQNYTFPSGSWSDGVNYNWSVSTVSTLDIESGWASDFTLVAAVSPSVAVTAPTGTVTATNFPVVTWLPSLAPGLAQIAYRVVLYTAAQAAIGGFTVGVSPSFYDSGAVASSATSLTIPVEIPNASGYKVYVQVTQTGGQTAWSSADTFTVNTVGPSAPSISAVAITDSNGTPCIAVTVTNNDTTYSSSIETITVTRSDGFVLRASPAAAPAHGSHIILYDYEAVPGTSYTYSAIELAAVGPGAVVASSAVTSGAVSLTIGPLWLILDPKNPTTTYDLVDVQQYQPTQLEQSAAHYPLAQPGTTAYPAVLASGVSGLDGQLMVETHNPTEAAKLQTIVTAQTVLWLASPLGQGNYVRLGVVSGTGSSSTGNKVQTSTVVPSPSTSPVQQWQLSFVGQPQP